MGGIIMGGNRGIEEAGGETRIEAERSSPDGDPGKIV